MSLKDYLSQNQASMKEWLDTRDRIIAQKIFEAYSWLTNKIHESTKAKKIKNYSKYTGIKPDWAIMINDNEIYALVLFYSCY